jgi:hypothetical protein
MFTGRGKRDLKANWRDVGRRKVGHIIPSPPSDDSNGGAPLFTPIISGSVSNIGQLRSSVSKNDLDVKLSANIDAGCDTLANDCIVSKVTNTGKPQAVGTSFMKGYHDDESNWKDENKTETEFTHSKELSSVQNQLDPKIESFIHQTIATDNGTPVRTSSPIF